MLSTTEPRRIVAEPFSSLDGMVEHPRLRTVDDIDPDPFTDWSRKACDLETR
jgi:hypothetical protein